VSRPAASRRASSFVFVDVSEVKDSSKFELAYPKAEFVLIELDQQYAGLVMRRHSLTLRMSETTSLRLSPSVKSTHNRPFAKLVSRSGNDFRSTHTFGDKI